MSHSQSNQGKSDQAQQNALIAFRELKARVELNEDGEAISLDLLDSPILDAHLEHLTALTKLERLYLSGLTRITDEGLHNLKCLTNLKELDISGSASNPDRRNITDAGLENLKGLTNLEKLNLDRTQITDKGLGHLKGITKLKQLSLRDTAVTHVGIHSLQQVLPNCKILKN